MISNYISNGCRGIINTAAQTVKVVTVISSPFVVSFLAHAASQDERIGKIVGGVGLVFSGLGLVLASGVPRTLKSWLWKDQGILRPEGVSKVLRTPPDFQQFPLENFRRDK